MQAVNVMETVNLVLRSGNVENISSANLIFLALSGENISGAISEERRLYLVRRQRYIETVMRDTNNAGMQSCTKSCYSIQYSIRFQ